MISEAGKRRLPGQIPLCTRMGREIPNVQDPELPPARARMLVDHYRRRYPGVRLRRGPTGQYNCHGLTFASRRTQVLDAAIIEKILEDDGYRRIRFREAQEGDVVVYYEQGEVAHTGVVLNLERNSQLLGGGTAAVLSKWGPGGEYIHSVNECPYVPPGGAVAYWSDRDEYTYGSFSELAFG